VTQHLVKTPGTVTRVGTGVPSNGLGENDDIYIDKSNGAFWHRESGAYVLIPGLVAQHNGSPVASEPKLNFVDTDVAFTVADDSPNSRANVSVQRIGNWFSDPTVFGSSVALPWSYCNVKFAQIALSGIGSGGSLASIGAPPAGAGTRVVLYNGSSSALTILVGSGIATMQNGNSMLWPGIYGSTAELLYNGSYWQLLSSPSFCTRIEASSTSFATGSTFVGFARVFANCLAVAITANGGSGSAAALQTTGIGPTGFTLVNGTGGTFPASWIAVGY